MEFSPELFYFAAGISCFVLSSVFQDSDGTGKAYLHTWDFLNSIPSRTLRIRI